MNHLFLHSINYYKIKSQNKTREIILRKKKSRIIACEVQKKNIGLHDDYLKLTLA